MKAYNFIKRITESHLENYDIMLNIYSVLNNRKDFYNENEELEILKVSDNAIIVGIE
jgi:predicted DNA-binding protein YlxM (UPF0122 family)